MTTIDDSAGTALGLIWFLLFVALYVWTALALSAVFRKSGEQAFPWPISGKTPAARAALAPAAAADYRTGDESVSAAR